MTCPKLVNIIIANISKTHHLPYIANAPKGAAIGICSCRAHSNKLMSEHTSWCWILFIFFHMASIASKRLSRDSKKYSVAVTAALCYFNHSVNGFIFEGHVFTLMFYVHHASGLPFLLISRLTIIIISN